MSSHALLAFGLLLGVVLTVTVGVDAHNRGRSGFLWGLLTLFTGLVGAFFYALVVLTGDGATDDGPDTVRYCSACATAHMGTPAFCSDCGESLGTDEDRAVASVLRSGADGYCSNCKSKVGLDAETCSNCGAVL
ncbi:zinc ribbon domain-containing protein [Salinigranum sp.]|uniref:double zinc ribbon domain-containing protein n=1 Tax=Salinigranum sp. TaxID=1966351 RepID=UPI003561B9F7